MGQQYCSPHTPVCWSSPAPHTVTCEMWGTIGIVVYCTLLWEHPHKLYCNWYATMYEFVLDLWLLSKVMSSSGLSHDSFETVAPKVLQAVQKGGLRLGAFVSQVHVVSYYCVVICHSCIPFISHCNCLHFLQNGMTPVLLAFSAGHSDVVDLLIGEYGCSMSDEEVSAVCWHVEVTCGIQCYHATISVGHHFYVFSYAFGLLWRLILCTTPTSGQLLFSVSWVVRSMYVYACKVTNPLQPSQW